MSNEIWPRCRTKNGRTPTRRFTGGCKIVGKVALAQAPPVNHSWGICHGVTPRGVSTQPLPYGRRSFTMDSISSAIVWSC